MMLNVIYPVIQDLGLPMIANGNWDTAAMSGMVSIGAVWGIPRFLSGLSICTRISIQTVCRGLCE